MQPFDALLAIRIADRAHLVDIFGIEAIDQALSDFTVEVKTLVAGLLSQHSVVTDHADPAKGLWLTRFAVQACSLPRDADEICAAIEAAGRKLMAAALGSVFGAATAQRVAATLAVSRLAAGVPPGNPEELLEWIAAHSPPPVHRPLPDPNLRAADVDRLFAERSPRTCLQPIVRMADRSIVGYEALTRGPLGSPLERPDVLFDAAHAVGRTDAMELLCAELALERTAGRLPDGLLLTINLGPGALAQAAQGLALAGRRNVVLELTEHLPLRRAEALTESVAALRAMDVGLALDDTGCGFADLDTARTLRPEIVKLCITVVRNAAKGSPFADAIRRTTDQLHALGCRVLAEGVETENQHAALSACGIELAQGWLYGRPAPVATVLADPLRAGRSGDR